MVESLDQPHPLILDGRCCRFFDVADSEIKSRPLAGEIASTVAHALHWFTGEWSAWGIRDRDGKR